MLKSIVIEKSFIIRLKRRLKIETFKTKIHKKKKKKRESLGHSIVVKW